MSSATRQIRAPHPWAAAEFDSTPLGDRRRSKRLTDLVSAMIESPGLSIPDGSTGWAETKAFYRLLGHPSLTDAVILENHRLGTLRRAKASDEAVLLAIQDTTSLNYGTRSKLEGLGAVGNNGKENQGLFLHGTLLVGAELGGVFGLLGCAIEARDGNRRKTATAGSRNREAITEKESRRWLDSYHLANRSRAQLDSATRVISVADREGDIYELLKLAEQHRRSGMGLLVRVQHDRALVPPDPPEGDPEAAGEIQRLWAALGEEPAAGEITIRIPRGHGMAARDATLTIRHREVTLRVPAHKKKYCGLTEPVTLHAIELAETRVKGDDGKAPERLCWRLLTTETARTVEDATRIARWYEKRWQIEVFHRVLKTGCRIEQRQSRSQNTLRPVIALHLVVAAYLMGLTQAARDTPGSPASGWLSEDEEEALVAVRGVELAEGEVLDVSRAVKEIAGLGGHLGRKGDGPPGAEVLWRGLKKLQAISEAWTAFKKHRHECG